MSATALNRDYRWPRWVAWIRAKLTGDWWIPCPICGSGFASFEAADDGVDYKMNGTASWECRMVCLKKECRREARNQSRAFYKAKDENNLLEQW